MRATVITASAMIALSACVEQAPTLPETATVDEAAVKASLVELRGAFEAAIANGDMTALGAIIADDTLFIQPASEEWRAMRARAGFAPFAPGAVIDINPSEMVVINEEWAYEFGDSLITYPAGASAAPQELRDTYLILLRNRGDGWKPYREVASAAPPPAGWTAGEGAPAPLSIEDLIGEWDVALYFDPDEPPSQTLLQITGAQDGTLSGSFYDTPFSSGEAAMHRGDVVASAMTSDDSGLYAHSMRMRTRDMIFGQTLSTGRGFVMAWEATRRTDDEN